MNGYKLSDLKHKIKAAHGALSAIVGVLDAFPGASFAIHLRYVASDLIVEARLLRERQKDHPDLREMLERCEALWKIVDRKVAA